MCSCPVPHLNGSKSVTISAKKIIIRTCTATTLAEKSEIPLTTWIFVCPGGKSPTYMCAFCNRRQYTVCLNQIRYANFRVITVAWWETNFSLMLWSASSRQCVQAQQFREQLPSHDAAFLSEVWSIIRKKRAKCSIPFMHSSALFNVSSSFDHFKFKIGMSNICAQTPDELRLKFRKESMDDIVGKHLPVFGRWASYAPSLSFG